MSGYIKVVMSELVKSADDAQTMVGVVKPLDPGSDLTSAQSGITGAGSISLMNQVGSKWETQLKAWGEQMHEWGENVKDAARSYESADEVGATSYRHLPTVGM